MRTVGRDENETNKADENRRKRVETKNKKMN